MSRRDRTRGAAGSGLHHLIGVDHGCHALDAGDLGGDGFGILQHERFRSRDPLASGVCVARNHKQHIGAEVVQLAFSQQLRSPSNPHQGDHRGVADHDAHHREQAAQAVAAQGGQGHPHRFRCGHAPVHGVASLRSVSLQLRCRRCSP